ncbi:hypothetical protein BHE74_00037979 [Ensete ventricosum]|nr:hypothetical protein BHE74_00037979 [Ensete ventricosum]
MGATPTRRLPAGRSTTRKTAAHSSDRQQGAIPVRAVPMVVPLAGTAPAHRGGHSRATTPAIGVAARGQGSRQWRTAPLHARRRRWSQDEGRRGGLGHPFKKRMVMPLRI